MPYSDPQAALRALRQRAEQRRRATDARALPDAPPDWQRLAQELQINQVELEMQYEELLVAQTNAELNQARYEALYDAAPVGYCTLDASGLLSQLNLATSKLLGRPRPGLLGRRLALFVAPAERGQFGDFLGRLWATPGQHLSCELTMRRDEQPFRALLEGVATLAYNLNQQEAGCQLVLLDVSERHRATQALAESEERFRATFEQSRDGMVLLDNQQFVDANDATLHLLGLSRRPQLLGRPLASCWPATQPGGAATQTLLDDGLAQTASWGWCRLELLRHLPDNSPAWDELSFNPIVLHGRALTHATWRDITVRKLQEQRLRESEDNLQLALAGAGAGAWRWHLASGALEQDARAQEIFGLSSGVPFALLQAATHPADGPLVAQALAQARHARTIFDLEHRLLRADNTVRYVAMTGRFSYHDTTGEAESLHGLVRDVTARRLAAAELDYKNRLLHRVLHQLPVVLTRLGPDGRFREHLGQPLRRLGLADNELLGRLAAEEFPESAAHYATILAGQSVEFVSALWRQGQLTNLQVFGFFDQEQQEAVLFGIEVTESERLKEEATRTRLRQQQELHAVILSTQEEERRRIAESLHNGVGQLLYATRLHLDTLPPSEALRDSQQLLAEAIRATRTISFELTPLVLEGFGLPTALRELVGRVPARSLPVDLHLRGLDEPLPASLATAAYRIVQELLNNVMKHAQAREVFVSVVCEAGRLYLSVEDDGIGFDPAARPPDPGIGLAGIRTRVGLLGGTFEVKSRPGRGSGFFLELPVQAGAAG